MRIIAALVLGLLMAPCTNANALVLCQKKHKVVARESCRPSESPLSLVGLGSPGGQGAPGGQGPAGRPPLRVIDALGSDVGPLVVVDYRSSTTPDLDLALLVALVTRPPLTDGALLGLNVAGRPTGRLYYASSDCTGTPLVFPRGLMPALQAIGDTVFGQDAPSAVTTAKSLEVNDLSLGCVSLTPRGSCCRTVTQFAQFDTATPVTTLTELGIVPPLHAVIRSAP